MRLQETGTRRCTYAGRFTKELRPFRCDQWSVVSGQCSAWHYHAAFTLVELLVSIGVLVLLVLLATQLLNSAATITTLGHKQMDADSQARQLLDRMAIDFGQMVKRSDVDYYLKSSAPTPLRRVLQPGNDQITFYSTLPGYYPTGAQSPVSLVAYGVDSQNKLERMGKGLVWNAVASDSTHTPVVFMPIPLVSPLPGAELPSPPPEPTPAPAWQGAIGVTDWTDSEVIGPQVFRFEYYYLLKAQTDLGTNTTYPAILSDIPWDVRIASCCASSTPPPSLCCHISPRGMQDVAAVVVVIAVIDPTSRVLLLDTTNPPQIAQVASQLIDWGDTACVGCPSQTEWQTTPGLLRAQWQNALNRITTLPRPAISGIRVYERYLYLSPPTLLTP